MFDILEAQNAEHNMKVTLLELYNKEIMDCVPPEKTVKSEDDKSKSPIALTEDWKGGFHC
ncbi:kinesin-like protein KIN-5D [Arachis hypogaea]|nr:kinesin-like protein KIN-5D [Arachis hypogaea]